jgi:non-ribosomal peptide synthetase component F
MVRAEREALKNAAGSSHSRQLLAGAPPLAFPPPRHASADALQPGEVALFSRRVELPDDLAARVRQLAAQHGLTVKSVLLAAHCLTLQRLTGTRDVTTAVVTHTRPELEGTERTVGMFLNVMPIRMTSAAAGTWLAAAQVAFRQERAGYAHRHYPPRALFQQTGWLPQAALNYVHFYQLTDVLRTPGLRLLELRTWEVGDGPLVVNAIVDPVDGRIALRIDTDARTLGSEQTDEVARNWGDILRRMTGTPNQPID